ncbi:MAG: hypothetical protein LR015_14185 [Verrucomicrobia bacterium]|nr:hypothetical protein [Verrucomicrobiota bacterium]
MIKAALEQVATKEAGLGGFLLSRMYTQATSASDTRIWSTLPREFQVACMDRPASGVVSISAESGLLQQEPMNVILAPDGMATVIYVSTPGKDALPLVRVFGLGVHQGQPHIQVVSQVDPLRLLAAGVN